jgi:hypothetical protein
MLVMIWPLPWEESVPVICSLGQRVFVPVAVEDSGGCACHVRRVGGVVVVGARPAAPGWICEPSFRTMMVGVCPPNDILASLLVSRAECRSLVSGRDIVNRRRASGGRSRSVQGGFRACVLLKLLATCESSKKLLLPFREGALTTPHISKEGYLLSSPRNARPTLSRPLFHLHPERVKP